MKIDTLKLLHRLGGKTESLLQTALELLRKGEKIGVLDKSIAERLRDRARAAGILRADELVVDISAQNRVEGQFMGWPGSEPEHVRRHFEEPITREAKLETLRTLRMFVSDEDLLAMPPIGMLRSEVEEAIAALDAAAGRWTE